MRLSTGARLALCFVVLAGLGAAEAAYSQCFGQCVVVAPPFCQRCREFSSPTGMLCQDVDECGCYEIQCAAAQAPSVLPEAQLALARLDLSAPVLASGLCSGAPAPSTPLASIAN